MPEPVSEAPASAAAMRGYPWAQPVWQRSVGAVDAFHALHHGLLITGVSGIAKREFAMALSQALLCGQSAQQPCGQCRHCALFQAGSHPDFHVLITEWERRHGRIELAAKYCDRYQDIAAREKRAHPGRVIAVEQVRQLIGRFHAHAHLATRKVALIMPADRMNTNAANALLKLLEEPPANSILILVSDSPGYLPATVRSRCFQIGIPTPSAEVAAAWLRERMPAAEVAAALALSNGAPLDAWRLFEQGFLPLQKQFLQDIAQLAAGKTAPLELSARFVKHDFAQLLAWLQRFIGARIKARLTGVEGRPAAAAEGLFALYDKIGYYRKIAREQLNEQLAMDELALALAHVMRS